MAPAQGTAEPILEPELPIIDPHHHLWCWPAAQIKALLTSSNPFSVILARHGRYLLDEFLADANTGHNIIGTVFIDAAAMYRQTGPEAMKPVGEIEFVRGVAAMAASGTFGPTKVAAACVGAANLTLGAAVEEVLVAEIEAGGGRFRGVRYHTAYDPDRDMIGGLPYPPHMLLDPNYRAGAKCVQKLGLSLDVWILEPQLPELIEFARAMPELTIILNHVATPVGINSYAGQREARFPLWRDNIRTLAKCANVNVKIGGLGMPTPGFKSFNSTPAATSEQLASEWKPYVETCVEAFGAKRCMFESNFPVDSGSGSYATFWNAFKRLAAGCSKDEKTALFSGTATRVYKVEI